MEISLNVWLVIFLFAAAQGIFLSFSLVMLKKGSGKSNRILSLIILFFSISLLYFMAFWTGYEDRLPSIISLPLTFALVYGPLIFLYFKTLINHQIHKEDFIHFLPFILLVIYRLYGYSSLDFETNTSKSSPIVEIVIVVFKNIHMTFYSILLFIFLRKWDKLSIKWLNILATFYAGFVFCNVLYYVLVWVGVLRIEYDYIISLSMSVFIYFVGYYGFINQEVFQLAYYKNKYEKSGLTKSALKVLQNKLTNYIAREKPFLDSNLRLQDLAKKMDLSPHQLSQVINENFNLSYSNLINRYRIDHAKELLTDKEYCQEKIINIAYDCGFNNKVSFNNSFKKFVKLSPTAYRKMIIKKIND